MGGHATILAVQEKEPVAQLRKHLQPLWFTSGGPMLELVETDSGAYKDALALFGVAQVK